MDRGVLALEADRPAVRAVEAVEDVHERRLARAVLAEQGVDLVLGDDEVDPVERREVAEALHDPAHLDHRDPLSWRRDGHAWPSISYGSPSAAGGRERPTNPATARIVRM